MDGHAPTECTQQAQSRLSSGAAGFVELTSASPQKSPFSSSLAFAKNRLDWTSRAKRSEGERSKDRSADAVIRGRPHL